jgi:hypothetical protein
VTITASELASGGAAGLKSLSVPSDVREQIENVVGVVEELNVILNATLFPFQNRPIPVSPDVTTFQVLNPSGPLPAR